MCKAPLTLKRRAEFLLAAAKGQKVAKRGFVMQMVPTGPDEPLRAGYTASRKVGNAVIRNRAKRRLREALRISLAEMGFEAAGADIVLIARHDTAGLAFGLLAGELRQVLAGLLPR